MRLRNVLAGLVTGAVLAASLAACDKNDTYSGELPQQPTQVPVQQQPDPYGGGGSYGGGDPYGGGGSYGGGGGGSSPVTPPTGPYTPGNPSSPYN